MRIRWSRLTASVALSFGVALLYFWVARLSLLMALSNTNACPFWPSSGIALAGLLFFGYRVWPGVALGAFWANMSAFTFNRVAEAPIITAVSVAIAAGNTLEAVAAKYLLDRFVGTADFLENTKAYLRFIGIAMLVCLISSTLGPLAGALAGIVPWKLLDLVWLTWWMGDVGGIVLFAPLLLSWAVPVTQALARPQFKEIALYYASLFVVAKLVFGGWFPTLPLMHMPFLVYPFLLWGALRFGTRETTMGLAVVSVVAAFGTTRQMGPFTGQSLNESLLALQSFICLTALTLSVLNAALSEMRLAQRQINKMNEALEARVIERTLQLRSTNQELMREVSQRRRLEGQILRVSESEKRKLGENLHDDLGQRLLGIAFMSKLLEHRLEDKNPEQAEQASQITRLINQTLTRVRDLAKGLYPVEVQAETLAQALEQLASTVKRIGKVQCEFQGDDRIEVPSNAAATQLYHIAQEAVWNALKHSKAQRIDLGLRQSGLELILSIEDDGVGVTHQPDHEFGLGRVIMSHRATRIGAFLEIKRRAGGGTAVSCSLPVKSTLGALGT